MLEVPPQKTAMSESGLLWGVGQALAELQLQVYFPLQLPLPFMCRVTVNEVLL